MSAPRTDRRARGGMACEMPRRSVYWPTNHASPAKACMIPGRGAVWLARLNGVQEVAGSNPVAPTDISKRVTLPAGTNWFHGLGWLGTTWPGVRDGRRVFYFSTARQPFIQGDRSGLRPERHNTA